MRLRLIWRRSPGHRLAYVRGFAVRVASLAQLGRGEDLEGERARIQGVMPDLSLAQLTAPFPFRDRASLEHLIDGLRRAGWQDTS